MRQNVILRNIVKGKRCNSLRLNDDFCTPSKSVDSYRFITFRGMMAGKMLRMKCFAPNDLGRCLLSLSQIFL